MSVVRGRPEVTGTQPTDAIDPERTPIVQAKGRFKLRR